MAGEAVPIDVGGAQARTSRWSHHPFFSELVVGLLVALALAYVVKAWATGSYDSRRTTSLRTPSTAIQNRLVQTRAVLAVTRQSLVASEQTSDSLRGYACSLLSLLLASRDNLASSTRPGQPGTAPGDTSCRLMGRHLPP
jgi:hypothetical protein